MGLRSPQIAWLNCHFHLHDLYFEDLKTIKALFTGKETVKNLVDAVHCENLADLDSAKRQALEKERVATESSTQEAISRIVEAVPKYKAMEPPEPSQLCTPRLTIVLIGRTNVGKTSFTNALTGLGLPTSIKGRCTVEMTQAPHYGKWYADDGRVWEFEVIDTPGVDDSVEQDEKTMELLTTEFTQRGNIHAVLLVSNAQAPTLDESLVTAIRKFHDQIFGDVFVNNWGVVYNKWYLARQEEEQEEAIVEEAKRILTELPVKSLNPNEPKPLGLVPAQFFFQDCVPDRKTENPEAARDFFARVDNFFDWVSSLEPMHTKVFLSYRKCRQLDIVNKQALFPWWFEPFDVKVNGTMIELTHTSFRALKTWMLFGLAGKFYSVRVIRLLFRGDFRGTEAETRRILEQIAIVNVQTLDMIFSRLEDFAQIYLEELVEKPDDSSEFWSRNRVCSYDCTMVQYPDSPPPSDHSDDETSEDDRE